MFITQRSRQTVTEFLRPRVEFYSLSKQKTFRAVTIALFSREMVVSRNVGFFLRLRVS